MNVRKINPFRAWYYMRQGYSNYIVFIIAVMNLMVTSYYLAIKDIPNLHHIFPNIATFGVFMFGIGIPLTLIVGYSHYKRTKGQHYQLEIEMESSPMTPIILQNYVLTRKLIDNESLNKNEIEQIKKIDELVKKYLERLR